VPREERHQLEWIVKNRAKRSRLSRASSAIDEVVTTIGQRGLEPALAVAGALGAIVDDEFRRHCRVAGAAGGRVTIHVDTASLVSLMRMKWLEAIRAGLCVVDRRLGGGAIVFEPGRSGVEIPAGPAGRLDDNDD